MHELSIWERETFFPPFDALIIGAGIVGLAAALKLKALRPRWRIAVSERGPLPQGASTRNAGFACYGSVSELLEDLTHNTEDQVFELVQQRVEGLAQLRELLGDSALRYETTGGTEVFTDKVRFRECAEAIPWLNSQLDKLTGMAPTYRIVNHDHGMKGVCGQIFSPGEGLLHPGYMMASLQRKAREAGVSLHFGLAVDGWKPGKEGYDIQTREGIALQSARILLATNGLSRRLLPELPVQGVRNQVLVTEPISGLRLRGAFHYQEGYFYFRHIGNRVLVGGGRHLDTDGETTDKFGSHDPIRDSLRTLLRDIILPGQSPRIDYAWSGILGIGATKQPILAEPFPGLFTAVRLGGMGVAIGVHTGTQAARLMTC